MNQREMILKKIRENTMREIDALDFLIYATILGIVLVSIFGTLMVIHLATGA